MTRRRGPRTAWTDMKPTAEARGGGPPWFAVPGIHVSTPCLAESTPAPVRRTLSNEGPEQAVQYDAMCTPRARAALVTLAVPLLAAALAAQDVARPRPKVAPSGRVTTSVTFDGRVLRGGGWFTLTPSHSGPSRITIDYGQPHARGREVMRPGPVRARRGQPHARGREVFGGLVPYGEVWRLGANWATRLTLDFDVRFGDLDVPRGEYTLFMLPRDNGGELVFSRQTRQWGTDYDPSHDFGKTPIGRRPLAETTPSLAITLEPNLPAEAGAIPSGTLRITWGEAEYFTDWLMLWP